MRHEWIALIVLSQVLCGGGPIAAQSQDTRYVIALANRRFTPQPGIEDALREAVARAGAFPVYGIAQLPSPPDVATRAALAGAGVALEEYLGGNAYIAAFAPRPDVERLRALVRWAGLLLAEDKLSPDICKGRFEDWARTPNGDVKVLVAFERAADSSAVTRILAKHARRFRRHGPNEEWAAEIEPARIRELAAENLVRWIEQGPHPMMPLSPG